MLVLVLVAVLVVAGLGAVAYVLLSQPAPPGVTLDRVEVTPSTVSVDQMGRAVLTAQAFDTSGVDQTGNATITWSASPAGAVQIATPGTQEIAQITGVLGGAATVTATAAWNGVQKTDQVSVTVAALHFVITTGNLYPIVNTPATLTVTATRADDTVATSYQGRVNFSAADYAAVTLPPDTAYTAGNLGTRNFDVTVRSATAVTIDVTDTVAPITGSITLTGNRRPLAAFALTRDEADHRIITVDASGSSDPDGDALTYSWSFGDATPTGSGVSLSHTYATPGDYTITLTVTDVRSAQAVATRTYAARAPPTAAFAIVSLVVEGSGVNLTVDASASQSNNPLATISWYNWTWGDGNTSSLTVPAGYHVYDAFWVDKDVNVTLNATDSEYAWATHTEQITVTDRPLPPIARFTATVDNATRSVTVDGRASSDPNGNLMWFNWTWGDGSWTNGTRAAGFDVETHQYPANGTYTITLTVVDSTNLTGTASTDVDVQQPPLPPVASFTYVRDLFVVDVDASSAYDPNGDSITYRWVWGDGSPPETSPGPTASHTYAGTGKFTVTLTVTDTTSRTGTESREVSVASSTLDYRYYDFFNVPYGEWWDYRYNTYGDLAINAECFNATSVADGVCLPNNPAVPDYATYPYTNWYPLPGNIRPGHAANNPMVYAPYRFDVVGNDVSGYNLSEPVFLPVLNYAEPRGTSLSFDLYMQYLDKASSDQLGNAGCGRITGSNDGFIMRGQATLTMDLQESRRLFGVVGATPAAAQSWWDSNAVPGCLVYGNLEDTVELWFIDMGNFKYDVVNSFEYAYTPFFTSMSGTVDPTTGETVVTIDHVAWGLDVLVARMFYWGNASYEVNYLDSTKRAGWWGMELAWFEDMTFTGSLTASSMDFTLNSAMQYHFQQGALPGPNGIFDKTDDVPYWTWGPILSDYTNDYTPTHQLSELDRYPDPAYSYVHSTPGSPSSFYGQNRTYDYAPISWDLSAGQTWHFDFPTTPVVFYDPNLTPDGADPTEGAYVAFSQTLKYNATNPASYGAWDAAAFTWDVVGPSVTGGPVGSPGPDGTPGTPDDLYPWESWGAIRLVPSTVVLQGRVSTAASPGPSGPSGMPSALSEGLPTQPFAASVMPARSEPLLVGSRK